MTSISIIAKGKHTEPSNSSATEQTTKGPWLRKWLSRLATMALIIVLGAAAAVAYGTVDNRWYKVVGVEGASMTPTIQPGDMIIISRPRSPEVGDIGVFQVEGKVVTHRIVDITDDGRYVTRGDANPSNDSWDGSQVELVGIYLFRIPGLGGLLTPGAGAWFTDVDHAAAQVSAGTYD